MMYCRFALMVAALSLLPVPSLEAQDTSESTSEKRLVLAHYMPWYVAKPKSQVWGWHWTMNHFGPDQAVDGKRQIASHYYPLIGPYDSGDEHVLEYHLLTMKLAGIDGVIVDWYGLADFRDYAILHRNTQRLVEQATRLDMKSVICYEDQTIPALVDAKRVTADQKVTHAVREIDWLASNWFQLDGYVQINGRPVLLSFGHAGLSNEEWTVCLKQLQSPVAYFSEHFRRNSAVGGFDWPIPTQGLAATQRFAKAARDWPSSIPVAYPRFVDIYAEAELHDSYGKVDDDDGKTFRKSLEQAFSLNSQLVQIATWNDWGEGTNIEPSREFGYRDLEVLQLARRKHIDSQFSHTTADLRLPYRLLQLRRNATSRETTKQLDQIASMLSTGKSTVARLALQKLEQQPE